mgnify:CR=1 FL=1
MPFLVFYFMGGNVFPLVPEGDSYGKEKGCCGY